ncbi:MAG: TPM domain-containing protein, partial [Planctomycetia bacterium]|nr:TPM domain-containing protein [Planctomycetia bacterium]
MIGIMKNLSILGAVALCLVINSDLKAEYREVKDPAGFFSENAKSEANRRILDIEKRFKHDLVIETFLSIPDDVKKGVDLKDKPAANRMYDQWARKQASSLRVNGVYILLTKEPGHLQIEVGNETQKKTFSLLDRDNLNSLMRTKLNEKQNDKALIEAVNFVYTAMESHPDNRRPGVVAPAVNNQNKPVAAAPRPQENNAEGSPIGGWICMGLLVLGGVWLVIAIFRALFGGGGAMAGGGGYGGGGMAPGYGGGGGGGFFSSLLGGMFGAAAGMYMYNNFFGGNHGGSSAYGADQTGAGDNGSSAQDTDYSGSGGDIDDNSGGGGGDFGNDA